MLEIVCVCFIKTPDSDWQPVEVTMNHLQYNGYSLSQQQMPGQSTRQQQSAPETMLICETVTNMDKRRIYLRSQIQVPKFANIQLRFNINTAVFCLCLYRSPICFSCQWTCAIHRASLRPAMAPVGRSMWSGRARGGVCPSSRCAIPAIRSFE